MGVSREEITLLENYLHMFRSLYYFLIKYEGRSKSKFPYFFLSALRSEMKNYRQENVKYASLVTLKKNQGEIRTQERVLVR